MYPDGFSPVTEILSFLSIHNIQNTNAYLVDSYYNKSCLGDVLSKSKMTKKFDKHLSCNVFLIQFAIEMNCIISQHIDF